MNNYNTFIFHLFGYKKEAVEKQSTTTVGEIPVLMKIWSGKRITIHPNGINCIKMIHNTNGNGHNANMIGEEEYTIVYNGQKGINRKKTKILILSFGILKHGTRTKTNIFIKKPHLKLLSF